MIRRAAVLLTVLAFTAASAPAAETQTPDANQPAGAKEKKPASSLDFWLNESTEVKDESAATHAKSTNPFQKTKDVFYRSDAMPGAIELSNGKQLPGGVYTTTEKPWIVWSEATKSWRRIPFVTLLTITAVVEEEREELRWRWKGMGEPERVYTGQKYPWRRMHWKFRLIDGSVVEGSTKGQPVWVELRGKVAGPFVLHERMKGQDGQTLDDLVYVKKVVVSRKMMDAVIEDVEKQFEKEKPDAP